MKRLLLLLFLFAPNLLAQNPVSGGPIPQTTYTTLPNNLGVPNGTTVSGSDITFPGNVTPGLPDKAHLLAWYQIKPTESAAALVDYSGNGRTSIGSDGTAPTIAAGTGGIVCNGIGGIVLPIQLTSSATTIMVFFQSGAQTQTTAPLLMGSTAPNTAFFLYNSATFTTPGTRRLYTSKSASNDIVWGTGSAALAMDTNDRLYLNGVEYTQNYSGQNGSSAGLQTSGSYQICGVSGQSYITNVTIYQVAIWSAVESAANIALADQVMTNLEVAAGVYKNQFNSTSDTTYQILGTGDSIGAGQGLAVPVFSTNIAGSLTLDDTWNVANVATSGFTAKQVAASAPAYISQLRPQATQNINVIWAGTNDVAVDGSTAAQIIGYLANNCRQTRVAIASAKCMVFSMASRTGQDAGKDLLNPPLRQKWSTFADSFVDIASDPNIGADGASANTLYFSDTVHPTQHASYNDDTPMVQRAINRAYAAKSFSEATTYTTGAAAATAITAASEAANTVTITSTLNPPVGSCVIIAGVTPAGYNSPSTGGCWLVLTTSGANFTFFNGTTGLGAGSVFGTAAVPLQKDKDVWVILGGSGTSQNFTLESCEGYTGQNLYFKNTNINTWTITAYAPTIELINGASSFTLASGATTTFQAILTSNTAGGCSWRTILPGGNATFVASTTAVTSSNPTINVDQNLIQLSLGAGFLNNISQPYEITGSGIYSSTAASTPALNFEIKLCTVSGCGSGTVVDLADITTTALNTTALTNATWNLVITCVTNATGATGNLMCHGSPGLTLDTGATLSAPDTLFSDTNTAVLANIDLTAALFVQFTVAQSVVGASNSYTQQLAAIR